MSVRNGNKIEVTPNTFWMMLLSTVRYALGRQSYIVADTVDLVLRSRQLLNELQLDQIKSEIEYELKMKRNVGKWLGHKMDHEQWQRLVTELEKT